MPYAPDITICCTRPERYSAAARRARATVAGWGSPSAVMPPPRATTTSALTGATDSMLVEKPLQRNPIAVLGPLSAPETVRDEVLRKSRQDDRFRAAATVWRKLTDRWIQILPDDVTPELAAVVQRISGLPMAERMKHAKDLGEIMSSPTLS